MDWINEYRHQIFYQGTGAGVHLVFKHTQSLSQLMTPAIDVTFFKSNLNICFIMCIFIHPHYKFKERMIFVAGDR